MIGASLKVSDLHAAHCCQILTCGILSTDTELNRWRLLLAIDQYVGGLGELLKGDGAFLSSFGCPLM